MKEKEKEWKKREGHWVWAKRKTWDEDDPCRNFWRRRAVGEASDIWGFDIQGPELDKEKGEKKSLGFKFRP